MPDGAFTRADAAGSVVFREGPAPTRADIAAVADISEGEVIVAILAHLKLPTEAPPMARARSPAFELA